MKTREEDIMKQEMEMGPEEDFDMEEDMDEVEVEEDEVVEDEVETEINSAIATALAEKETATREEKIQAVITELESLIAGDEELGGLGKTETMELTEEE
jgi:hypothetical protein